jgi:hypothetical protein
MARFELASTPVPKTGEVTSPQHPDEINIKTYFEKNQTST